eukprot:7260200-Prymnesium_polylepis.1
MTRVGMEDASQMEWPSCDTGARDGSEAFSAGRPPDATGGGSSKGSGAFAAGPGGAGIKSSIDGTSTSEKPQSYPPTE